MVVGNGQEETTFYDRQVETLARINKDHNPNLDYFEQLPGKKDRDKAIYLMLSIGLSPKRIAKITGLSRSSIERKINNGF